jgi:hypothetical protein
VPIAGWRVRLPVRSSSRSTTITTTFCKSHRTDCRPTNHICRVRAKVINGDEECIVDADKWPRGLYQNGMYDPASPDKGLFKSMSLLQVRFTSGVMIWH